MTCVSPQLNLDIFDNLCGTNGTSLTLDKYYLVTLSFPSLRNWTIWVSATALLNFLLHGQRVVGETSKRIGLVKRCTVNFKSLQSIKMLYWFFAWPCLEYTFVIPFRHPITYEQSIERVQHIFFKLAALNLSPEMVIADHDYSPSWKKLTCDLLSHGELLTLKCWPDVRIPVDEWLCELLATSIKDTFLLNELRGRWDLRVPYIQFAILLY